MGRDLGRIGIALLVFVVVAGAWYMLGGGGEGVQAGQRAPDFTAERFAPAAGGNGTEPAAEPITLAALRGQPVFLNFWATWCPPCRWEMPFILEVQKARPDVHVYTINVGETEEEISAYLDEVGLTELNVLMDKKFSMHGQYQLTGLPTSIFLNAQGTICTRYAGAMTREMMEAALVSAEGDC